MPGPYSVGNQFGYLCPTCKKGDELSIEVTRMAKLFPDGTDDEPGDTEWDDDSKAECACGWAGTVKDLEEHPDFDEDDEEEDA